MSEISVDGSEKVTSHGSHTVCEAAVHEALLRECLYHEAQRQTYDLIRFDRGISEAISKNSTHRNKVG